MNSRLAKHYVDAVQKSRGWDYRPALAELETLQWASPEEVHNRRTAKLRLLLDHCERNVPFYRDEFGRLGLVAGDIKDEADLVSLPRITKDRIRVDYSRFWATANERPWDRWPTSGSSGQPFAFRIDRAAIAANTFAALARGRRWWGCDYGVAEAMIWSGVRGVGGGLRGHLHAVKRRIAWSLKNIALIDTYTLDAQTIREGYERLRRKQPRLIRAISSGLYRFCAGLVEQELDGRRLGVECAIYTGEALPPGQRALVERVLGCPTVCEYGCTELGILAFQCPAGGLHVSHEDLVLEFVRDGRPALPGEEAELVVTNLNAFSAPLVRYDVGDVVVPSDATCDCGRTLPLIDSVGGRAHDVVYDGLGGVIHGLFFTHLFDDLPHVHQFRVVQEAIDHVRIELRSTDRIPPADMQRVGASVKQVLRRGAAVDVEQVDGFPVAANGKFRWIESKVDAPEGRA